MITPLRKVIEAVDEQLARRQHLRAETPGLIEHRSGWLGLSRTYSNPYWAEAKAASAEEIVGDDEYAGFQQVSEVGLTWAWRGMDSASSPRHWTRGEEAPHAWG